jgi:flavin-dependent dehydrogenase
MVRHDVLIVGTRCAGAPLAMLLARKGYKVLGVSRSDDADLRIHIEGGEPQGSGLRRSDLSEGRSVRRRNHAFHGRAGGKHPVQGVLQPGKSRAITGVI